MNNEILTKARAAKTPDELLKLAHENGMPEFNEKNANAYFEVMHSSGELSDDELENAAGGCKKNNRRVVTLGNLCVNMKSYWRCKHCLCPSDGCHCNIWRSPTSIDKSVGVSMFANIMGTCANCGWCSYENGMWYCNNPEANKQ